MNHKFLLIGILLLAMIGIGVSGSVSAASSASVSFLDSGDQPEYQITGANPVDDGYGCDFVATQMTDATGQITDIDVECLDLGSGSTSDDTDWGSYEGGYEATQGPITYTVYDIGNGNACTDIDENSTACANYLASNGVCIGENYYQPSSLPAGTPYRVCGGAHASGCSLVIPVGSVVGDMPFNTQIYWAPGKVSPGNFLNPGTYTVVGEDETGGYYKVVLACQFIWVPVESMQPSYAAPQNGAPLPTNVVS